MSLFALFALLPLAALTAASPSSGSSGKSYTISPSHHPHLCLAPASASEGADLVLKPCETASDIVFEVVGDELRNTETNMCVDVRDGHDSHGTLLQMWTCYGFNTNQRFDINDDEIKWVGYDRCMDLKDGVGEEGTGAQIWSCYSYNDNQRWLLTDAEEVEDDSPAPPQECEDTGQYLFRCMPVRGSSEPTPIDDNGDENVPYCDGDGDDAESEGEGWAEPEVVGEAEHTWSRRGRGQHWQRSLDSEFSKLDRSYIPQAPAPARRSRDRRSPVLGAQATLTSTGL